MKHMKPIKQFFAFIGVAFVLTFALVFSGCVGNKPAGNLEFKTFGSHAELVTFLKENSQSGYGYGRYGGSGEIATTGAAPTGAASNAKDQSIGGTATDYSTTNIQVEGVDEADIVKNDGKYIYTISGSNVAILDAYPAASARVLSTINSTIEPQELYINGDRLVIIGSGYMNSFQETQVLIYDVSDRANPVLSKNFSLEGGYKDSRMIGDYVYAVVNKYTYSYYYIDDNVALPLIYDNGQEITAKYGVGGNVHYFDSSADSYEFTTIASINTQDGSFNNEIYLTSTSGAMYVSTDNIYLTHPKTVGNKEMLEMYFTEVFQPMLPADVLAELNTIRNSDAPYWQKTYNMTDVLQNYVGNMSAAELDVFEKAFVEKSDAVAQKIAEESQKTVIHKLAVDNGQITYKTQGEVPGEVLNQFSMDEYNDNFRIATTTYPIYHACGMFGGCRSIATSAIGASSNNMPQNISDNVKKSNIYVLDSGLQAIGKVEGMGLNENLHSARFMGDRAYLVTFKKTDPLYVIDLADPTAPKILGELKIPGYSDYLHPYDETHLIGIGKGAIEAEQGDFAWYQGVKLSLFDVSDVANPKELANYSIGDRGTDSYALYDHKAFLFSKSKNLLVVPIQLALIPEGQPKMEDGGWPAYGETVFQGAYVFDLTLENGFVLKGRVTHQDNSSIFGDGYYYYGDASSVKRALYMDDTLYTVSEKTVKANGLATMGEIADISLPYSVLQDYYPPLCERGVECGP